MADVAEVVSFLDDARAEAREMAAEGVAGYTATPEGTMALLKAPNLYLLCVSLLERAAKPTAAVELAGHGITVNAVMPGNVYTEGLAAYGQSFLDSVKAIIPTGTIGSVRDIGYACLYLASKEAGFVTGQTLVLDGGQTVPETPDFAASW